MTSKQMRVLVLGASGMLGNAVLRFFAQSSGYETFGSVRSSGTMRLLPNNLHLNIITGVDIENIDSQLSLFGSVRPDVVINCIGLIKQSADVRDPLKAIPVNALFPHRLARLCEVFGTRLVQMSTDCVFSGATGMYTEADFADANDLYGRSKFLGEVDYSNAITLRTSIIGHELAGARSLVEWFLAQEGSVKGFKRAIFSGVPTVEIARIIRDFVIPHPELHGVYHVSAEPINKYDLLRLLAQVYKKSIVIIPDDQLAVDRSLDSSRFHVATAYNAPVWPNLVHMMYEFG